MITKLNFQTLLQRVWTLEVLIFRTRSKILRPYRLFSDPALDDAEVCAQRFWRDSYIVRYLELVDIYLWTCHRTFRTYFYFECWLLVVEQHYLKSHIMDLPVVYTSSKLYCFLYYCGLLAWCELKINYHPCTFRYHNICSSSRSVNLCARKAWLSQTDIYIFL